MKKIFGLFLMLVFLSGCIPSLEQVNGMVKEGVHKLKAELQKDLGIEEYSMQVGDYVMVDNKLVRLESYNSDYVVEFDIEGHKVEMRTTQEPLIVEGLELTIKEFRFDASSLEKNYVKVKVTRFVPDEDYYLFYLDDIKNVLGHDIELINIEKSGTVLIRVDMVNELRIMEDATEGVANLYISNARPVYRAINNERHVILKIVEKP